MRSCCAAAAAPQWDRLQEAIGRGRGRARMPACLHDVTGVAGQRFAVQALSADVVPAAEAVRAAAA